MTALDQDTQPQDSIVEEVLAGKEKIVSHEGASQYRGGGIAACGLAALNFVRIVLARVEQGLKEDRLLKIVVSESTINEVISICARWPSNAHLEVEDVFSTPLFQRALTLTSSIYDELGFEKFREMLLNLQSTPNAYAAVLITRPPEIITCFKLPVKGETVFIIFDSHPRPEYPNGSGLILNTSLNATAARLAILLAVDDRVLADSGVNWQIQLLSHFSGHYFVPKGGPVNSVAELTQSLLESSLAVLSLKAEVADLRRQYQLSQTELDHLKDSHGSITRKPSKTSRSPKSSHISRKSTADHAQSSSGPSRLPTSSVPMNALEYFKDSDNIMRSVSIQESWDHRLATQLQREMDLDHERHRTPKSPTSRKNSAKDPSPMNALEYFRDSSIIMRQGPGHESRGSLPTEQPEKRHSTGTSLPQAPDQDHANDRMVAARLQADWEQSEHKNAVEAQAKQREFEEENARLLAERAALQKEVQSTFDCGVCFDKHPEDYIARIAGCKHDFCRDCLRTYVISKLDDKSYPMFCPMCLADDNCTDPAMLTDDLVQMLGLNDQQYVILQELQIASLSILLHCRKCKQSIFVDRDEHETTSILVCPLPNCDHIWCKACQQTIEPGGPMHSCDGSTEMEHLMRSHGWRHCPNCKTTFQKSSGCNHMTCMGCHAHFCYACGGFITDTVVRREIESAVSAHYSRCTLFEDVL